MYRHCIFCSADFGTNAALEEFPVGRNLAFDGWKGRLWAVCSRCGRWNLAPIEERWEAVESAERRFRTSRLRVHSENIGLAQLPDGTRLVRVGEALPGELAAWRYGKELRQRRQGFFFKIAASLLFLDIGLAMLFDGRSRTQRTILHRIPAVDSPTGAALQIQALHLQNARLQMGSDGILLLKFPRSASAPTGHARRWWIGSGPTDGVFSEHGPPLILEGEKARFVLARGLVRLNTRGASQQEVRQAVDVLERAGSAEACLREFASAAGDEGTIRFECGFWRPRAVRMAAVETAHPMSSTDVLALEMALHEETERRALEEDLKRLEAAWREAEEIARIADALPDDPLAKLRGDRRLSRPEIDP